MKQAEPLAWSVNANGELWLVTNTGWDALLASCCNDNLTMAQIVLDATREALRDHGFVAYGDGKLQLKATRESWCFNNTLQETLFELGAVALPRVFND